MSAVHPSRRDIFRLSGGALALNSISPISRAEGGAAFIRGCVTNTDTGLGLPGIRISNGCEIALTDSEGKYILRSNGDAPVFVIKPSGWAAPIDQKTMLPQIHRAPTTRHPLDFSLRPVAEPETFDVIMFADPQPANEVELGYLLAQINNGPLGSTAAFGLTLGDLVGDDLSLFARYNQIISQIGLPWWNLPGNHDLDFSAASSSDARAPWRSAFGPTTYAFEYGAATFIMLDNIQWNGEAAGERLYCGQIGDANLAFVDALLKTTPHERLIVLCMHIPLISASDPLDPGSSTSDRNALLALVGDRPCVSFSGHMHTTEHHYLPLPGAGQHHHHILTALSGSWWSGPMDALGQPMAQSCDGVPNGWHILTIEGSNYSTRFVSAREPSQMRIMVIRESLAEDGTAGRGTVSGGISKNSIGDMKILINVFDGGPRTTVEACVSGCSPSVTERTIRPDPLTQDLFQRAGQAKKPWVRAEPSSHIWQARLPADLAPGLHRLNVSATTEYGQLHQGGLIFEVMDG